MTSKIMHYDTIQSNKTMNNSFSTNFLLSENLKNVNKIGLRSCELSPLINFRGPYSTFYYSIMDASLTTTNYSFIMPDKAYTSINTILYDLNLAIVTNIQPKLLLNEVAPIFSLSSDSSKLMITYSYVTSQLSFSNNGLILYYLGRSFFSIPVITGTIVKTSISIFQYCYNLNFDTYVNMNITNISSTSKNNNSSPCHFKLLLKGNSLGYSFIDEAYLHQTIDLSNQTSLSNISISITDRYGCNLFSIHDFSFTLEYFF